MTIARLVDAVDVARQTLTEARQAVRVEASRTPTPPADDRARHFGELARRIDAD